MGRERQDADPARTPAAPEQEAPAASGVPAQYAPVLALQRSIGNRAVSALLAAAPPSGSVPVRRSVIRRTPVRAQPMTDTESRPRDPAGGLASSGTAIQRGTRLVVETAATVNAPRTVGGTDETWVELKKNNGRPVTDQFVPARPLGLGGATQQAGESGALDTVGDVIGAAGVTGDVSTISDTQTYAGKYGGSATGTQLSTTDATNVSTASGAVSLGGMFLTLARAIRTFQDEAADGAEKAQAALELASGANAGATGIASIVQNTTNSAGKSAEAVGGLGMIGELMEGIKATFSLIRRAVELAKEAKEPGRSKSSQEKFHAAMDTIANIMTAAKSGVSTAKIFLDTFNSAGNAALANSVPGMGIALGACDLIVRGVDLISARIQASRMRSRKQDAKVAIGGAKGTTSKEAAEAIITAYEDKLDNDQPVTDADTEEYENAREYLTAKGIQYVNTKRGNRAILKMSVSMTKIAGDVATLSGAAAGAGIGLKAGGAALDAGSSLFRRFKQWGRDKKAAKMVANGGQQVTGFFGLFNEKKSSEAKIRGYNQMVDKVFDMVVKAGLMPDARPPEKTAREAAMKKVSDFVDGIGYSIPRMYALQDDPATIRSEMIKALQKRE